MPDRLLAIPVGYNPDSQKLVGAFAWQLDDQSARLKNSVTGLEVRHLEWQPRLGNNTIGMLMAHIAVAEVYWFQCTAVNLMAETDGDRIVKDVLGILPDDDGMPRPADGPHPTTLAGKTLPYYFDLLDRARAASHTKMQSWSDTDLEYFVERRGFKINRSWMAYHVLEHQAGHFGQILLLKHQMVDAGLLPREPKK